MLGHLGTIKIWDRITKLWKIFHLETLKQCMPKIIQNKDTSLSHLGAIKAQDPITKRRILSPWILYIPKIEWIKGIILWSRAISMQLRSEIVCDHVSWYTRSFRFESHCLKWSTRSHRSRLLSFILVHCMSDIGWIKCIINSS